MATDVLSEHLIAQILQEDLNILESQRQAEQIQLGFAIAASAAKAGRIPKKSATSTLVTDDDQFLALKLAAHQAQIDSDAAFAASLQGEDRYVVADQQLARKLAAAENKHGVDWAFAQRLQAEENDLDIAMDAETVLGRDLIDNIISSNPNEKGKGKDMGKGRSLLERLDKPISKQAFENCGICMEPFQVTVTPIKAASSANQSSRLSFGMCLPCPKSHGYCIDCLSSYISSKIDPDGRGEGVTAAPVFPIACPECPILVWPGGIDDDIAERILGEKRVVLWYHQRLLDSLPKLFCPHKDCSALVQVHEDPDQPQAQCPACNRFMCVPCKVRWHQDMSCEEYQALPLDERSPEDRALLDLAKANNWRRCPSCSVVVELSFGCNHMTCRCGTHFCFKCGSLWDKANQRCTRNPSCDLWDENLLLAANHRARENGEAAAVPPPIIIARPAGIGVGYVRAPELPAYRAPPPYMDDGMDWINDTDAIAKRHPFTTEMLRSLQCGYCYVNLNSLADLRYHLEHITRHPVYACCGRFFKREIDMDKHEEAVRWHRNQCRRN